MSNANVGNGLLDLDALAARLGVGRRYARRLVEERRIPYRKIGRLVRFDPDEVEAWIEERRVEAFSPSPTNGRSTRVGRA